MSIEITPQRLRERAELVRQYQRVLPSELPVLLSESARQIEELNRELSKCKDRERKIRQHMLNLGWKAVTVYGDGHGEPSIDDLLEELTT